MKRVIIESPFAGDRERNIAYARAALLDSLKRDEAPFASHLLYPQALDEDDPYHRMWGIKAGYAWWDMVEVVAFYTDLGWSKGMTVADELARDRGKRVEHRHLGGMWVK